MFSMRARIILLGLSSAGAMLPLHSAKADQVGRASWYVDTATASGEPFDASAMTAAHRSLPFGTQVLVENLSNGRSVVVRINDRGPYIAGRIIDLSKGAASTLGMLESGVVPVRVSTPGGASAAPAVAFPSASTQSGATALRGGLLRGVKDVTQVAARQRTHNDVATASKKPTRMASRHGRAAA
jgi:peptidoglycan lytic transglycosylase